MRRWARTGMILAIAVSVCCGMRHYRQQWLTEDIAGKVIRFHVLANSDTKQDQNLKLKVRDAVGAYLGPKLSGVSGIDEGRRVIEDSLPQIARMAENTVAREGYTYEVQAFLAMTDFPQKTYGSYTFPEGRYEALEVVLGNGAGHNWWCVMYPNLCFFNSVYEVVDEEADKSLRRVLTEEEYKSLMETKNYKVKSAFMERILELLT